MTTRWWVLDAAHVATALDTDLASGLDGTSAATRLARDGANEIATIDGPSWLHLLLGQFRDTMILLLTVALQLAAIYLPLANRLLHTAPLSLRNLAHCCRASACGLLASEVVKIFRRRHS